MPDPSDRRTIPGAMPTESSVLRDARREAIVAAMVAALATAYSLGYCTYFGYGREGEPLRFVLGVPSWIFWGIVVPWVACTVVCGWFSAVFMKDDEFGEVHEDEGLDHA